MTTATAQPLSLERRTLINIVNNKVIILCLLCLATQCGMAQQHSAFNGVLTNLDGKPVKRAHVWVKSECDYALTDGKGCFGLTDVKATDTLHVSLKKQTWVIPVEGRKSLRICLADAGQVKQADEDQQLVDLGFGFVSRREHTGVSNFISGDELRRSGQNDVLSALQGRVPGLSITGSGSMGNHQHVNMRGERSFTADSTPLYIIDTVVVPSFEGLSLNDVDYVEIMKEASVYGSQGANGAIIVHTKATAK